MNAAGLDSYFANFSGRLVQDALNEATAVCWTRRAEEFERAVHRPGDFPGLCSVKQIEEANARCAAKALACRRRASLCEFPDFDAVYEAIVAESDAEHRAAA